MEEFLKYIEEIKKINEENERNGNANSKTREIDYKYNICKKHYLI